MSDRNEDIAVRIRAEYDQALADIQRFIGNVDKEFGQLPKVVRQLAESVDGLAGKIDGLSPRLRRTNEEATRLAKTFEILKNTGQAIAAGMAAWKAGEMVVMPHVERMLDYDTKLGHLANVAFSGRNVAGRIAGKAELDKLILGATREGGGNRDQAIDAYQRLIGSGAVSDADAGKLLPWIMKSSTAAGATPDQVADIGIRAMQNFDLRPEDFPKVIDMAIKSGNIGGFELKDMARWLPAQMAEASALGMTGEKGLAQLLALNQASITTAGSADAAGNNVVNLLRKINGRDTQIDFDKMGIDLSGSLQAAVGKGMDPITAFARLIDGVMSKDREYVDLEKKRKAASSDDERLAILEQQLQLAEGTAIGKVLQDAQARAAFLGYKKQGETFGRQVDDVLKNSAGTTDDNFAVIAGGPGHKRQQALNDQLDAQNQAMQKLTPALESYWSWTSKIAREYPVLNMALEGGKIGVGTLAAASGTAAVVMALLSKNATAASIALGGVAAAGGAKGLGGMAGAGLGKAGRMFGVLGAGLAGWEFGTHVVNPLINSGVQWATDGKSSSLGGWIYDVTHKEPTAAISPRVGFRSESGLDSETISRALRQSSRDNPIEAKLNLSLMIDGEGNARVKDKSMSGTNFRLDVGPTMTH